jgi:hypothetical protein
MSIDISRETEARLVDEALRQSISVETLLEQLLNERRPCLIAGTGPTPTLPLWHLGGCGALHRRYVDDDCD